MTQKSKIDFILGNDSFFNNSTVNPSFKVMEEIYSNGKISFFDRLHKSKQDSKERQVSLTPIPTRYYRDTKSMKKEDIFLNPAAFYLSKKPIAFSKLSREAQRQKSLVTPIPEVKIYHKKTRSDQLCSNFDSLAKDSSLVPMKDIKEVSPRSCQAQTLLAKEKHCEALVQLSNYCLDSLKAPTPLIKKQQKLAERYSKEMDWITDTLQSYGQYKPKILKELFKYTSDSRDDLELEREKIVNLMKTGAYDPNKNVVKLRARLKKKKDKV